MSIIIGNPRTFMVSILFACFACANEDSAKSISGLPSPGNSEEISAYRGLLCDCEKARVDSQKAWKKLLAELQSSYSTYDAEIIRLNANRPVNATEKIAEVQLRKDAIIRAYIEVERMIAETDLDNINDEGMIESARLSLLKAENSKNALTNCGIDVTNALYLTKNAFEVCRDNPPCLDVCKRHTSFEFAQKALQTKTKTDIVEKMRQEETCGIRYAYCMHYPRFEDKAEKEEFRQYGVCVMKANSLVEASLCKLQR